MSDVQRIDKITFTNTKPNCLAECTLHYREAYEPSQIVVTIEDVENGQATVFLATGEETFDIRNGVTIISLSAENLKAASDWYSANTTGVSTLNTQKV